MSSFAPGQRFVSEAEPELGLGRVLRAEGRRIVLGFPASDTVREYATDTAPIRRVSFRVGDEVEDERGRRFRIESVEEGKDGLLLYRGGGIEVAEATLSGSLSFSTPEERLLAGLWDERRVFDLRYRAGLYRHEVLQSQARGFLGARIELIPHQLYISREVASRPYPRALLADEVGLGKTIEAGLVLHRLLRSGRASRVLILVPEPLVHQWFVELFRRFHLSFTLADVSYCDEVEAASVSVNPFEETQTAIVSLEFLASDPVRRGQAEEASWDLVVVDEAHHLAWSEDAPSAEYRLVEKLARRSPGLLLLTATPEQLGEESHFARLRLLDPDRYPSFGKFLKETKRYRHVAAFAAKLIEEEPIAPEEIERLVRELPPKAKRLAGRLDSLARGEALDRRELLEELMDQHGPGRVIFRNARKVLAQFPKRELRPWRLEWPTDRAGQFEQLASELVTDTRDTGLVLAHDYRRDARVLWLAELLRELDPEKVLVIARTKEKAIAIQEALRSRSPAPVGLFHEGLSLLQRDRNAAWFADEREGARALVCSEIGSEGRNFQFAHHLVLFDLPLNPELLEQRIGRLHRIGQEETVQIHVPVLGGSPQEMVYLWYQEGLDAFETSLPSGAAFDGLASRLRELVLDHIERCRPETVEDPPDALAPLLEETRELHKAVLRELEEGRDRLLELSSFRPREAEALITEIRRWDQDEELDRFIEQALDYLGVELDRIGPRTFVFRQGSQLVVEALPGLRAEEVGMTADRFKATHQGELDFLTWDHPMVIGVMEILLGSEHGNSAVAVLPAQEPSALLECVFVLEPIAAPELDAARFLPPTLLRFVVDHGGRDVTEVYPREKLAGTLADGRQELRGVFSSARDELVPRMLERARALADEAAPRLVEESLAAMRAVMGRELERLRALREVNDHVREEEVERVAEEMGLLESALGAARVRLDALRFIYAGSASRSG